MASKGFATLVSLGEQRALSAVWWLFRPCRYAALEGQGALAMKGTLVCQAAHSSYALTEARIGGRLTRHDLSVQQARSYEEAVSFMS